MTLHSMASSTVNTSPDQSTMFDPPDPRTHDCELLPTFKAKVEPLRRELYAYGFALIVRPHFSRRGGAVG
jgi:hypothetical protein